MNAWKTTNAVVRHLEAELRVRTHEGGWAR